MTLARYVFAVLFIPPFFSCSASGSSPPSDPCAAIDHCPPSVNALLWCRNLDAGRFCPDTLRAWANCWGEHCDSDAARDPDGGVANPCAAAAEAHHACLYP